MPRQQQQQQLMEVGKGAIGEDEIANGAADGDEVMEEDHQEGYGHEYFCEVSEEFIEDDFNLTGLNSMVPFWKEAMEMVLDVEPEEDSQKIPDVSIVEASAELLYGLVHQRYILTRAGLHAMAEKYENGQFGTCPRVFCLSCHLIPCGRSDLPGIDTVKLYCPNCNDIYTPPSSRFQGVDGAFFGTTFAHLFFQTYREFAPAPFAQSSANSSVIGRSPGGTPAPNAQPFVNENPYGGQKAAAGKVYTPRIYGFRVSERAKSGPRMRWLRLRPENLTELDSVDWRGRFLSSDDEYEDGEGEGEGEGRMEDFDPDANDEDEEEEEEEEEEDGAINAPQSAGRRRAGAHETQRPATPVRSATSPPTSSAITSPSTEIHNGSFASLGTIGSSGKKSSLVRVVRTVGDGSFHNNSVKV